MNNEQLKPFIGVSHYIQKQTDLMETDSNSVSFINGKEEFKEDIKTTVKVDNATNADNVLYNEELLFENGILKSWAVKNEFIIGILNDVNTLSAQQSLMSDRLNEFYDLEDRQNKTHQKVETLQSDVSTLQSDVSTLQSDVSTLQIDVSTLESEVNTNKDNIATLQTDVSKKAEYSYVINEVSALNAKVDANRTYIDNQINLVDWRIDNINNIYSEPKFEYNEYQYIVPLLEEPYNERLINIPSTPEVIKLNLGGMFVLMGAGDNEIKCLHHKLKIAFPFDLVHTKDIGFTFVVAPPPDNYEDVVVNLFSQYNNEDGSVHREWDGQVLPTAENMCHYIEVDIAARYNDTIHDTSSVVFDVNINANIIYKSQYE